MNYVNIGCVIAVIVMAAIMFVRAYWYRRLVASILSDIRRDIVVTKHMSYNIEDNGERRHLFGICEGLNMAAHRIERNLQGVGP